MKIFKITMWAVFLFVSLMTLGAALFVDMSVFFKICVGICGAINLAVIGVNVPSIISLFKKEEDVQLQDGEEEL